MYRIISFVTFFLFFLSGVNAQKITSGSFDCLKRGDKVRISVDYSKASIHGLTEDEFADYEMDWLQKKDEICSSFVAAADEKLNGRLYLGAFKDAVYEFKVNIIRVNTKGDTFAEAVLVTRESNEVMAKVEQLKASGGHFGSKLNLMKDGAEHTGELLGKLIRRKVK